MTTMTRTRNRTELLKAVQACQTTEEAHGLMTNEINALRATNPNLSEERARGIVLEKIGHITTGCGSRAEAARVLKLFGTVHPYFGKIESWPATPEQIFEAGWTAGMQLQRHFGGDGEGEDPDAIRRGGVQGSGIHQG
jgi:hypothetical protein